MLLDAVGRMNRDTSSAYGYLGIAYADLQQHHEALQNLQEGLDINMELLGPQHPYVAYSYTDIGAVYSRLGRDAEARERYLLAQKILVMQYGPIDPRTVRVHENLAALDIDPACRPPAMFQ
eukprot:m.269821 g.269821  ORF g.269821 m.269821 type:complete len:121 (-) comp37503_c0_seq1:58-420(-)